MDDNCCYFGVIAIGGMYIKDNNIMLKKVMPLTFPLESSGNISKLLNVTTKHKAIIQDCIKSRISIENALPIDLIGAILNIYLIVELGRIYYFF